MAAPSRFEMATALYGAWRLIRGDAGGSAYFRPGRDGFWTAAWAVVLVAPAHLLTLTLHLATDPARSFDLIDAVREVEILVIGWYGYALLAFYVLKGFGKLARFDGYMAAYFWTTVPLACAETLLTMLQAVEVLPGPIETILTIGFLMLLLWARWFVARIGLAIGGGEAAAIVGGTILFEMIVGKVLSPLL